MSVPQRKLGAVARQSGAPRTLSIGELSTDMSETTDVVLAVRAGSAATTPPNAHFPGGDRSHRPASGRSLIER
jgi:hypothetical protein